MRRRPPRSTRTDTRFPYTTRFRSGGRIGEAGAHRLAQQLRGADLPMARLKTGTPPRLDGRTINWAQLDEQPSDSGDWTCSTWKDRRTVQQIFCAMHRTNAATHANISDNTPEERRVGQGCVSKG